MTTTESVVLDETGRNLLFRDARTANTFSSEPVSDEQVRQLYDLVKFGPTSMNQQPLRIVLVRTPAARAKLVHLVIENNKPKTASAPLSAVLAADLDFHVNLPEVFPHLPNAKDYYADPDGRASAARLNAGLQIGYFILGVRALGLAAGPMTGFDAPAVTREFFPHGRHEAMVVVNIGKPGRDAWYPRSPRLAYDRVVRTV